MGMSAHDMRNLIVAQEAEIARLKAELVAQREAQPALQWDMGDVVKAILALPIEARSEVARLLRKKSPLVPVKIEVSTTGRYHASEDQMDGVESLVPNAAVGHGMTAEMAVEDLIRASGLPDFNRSLVYVTRVTVGG